jgi:membrane-associated phospholipid phosphatase
MRVTAYGGTIGHMTGRPERWGVEISSLRRGWAFPGLWALTVQIVLVAGAALCYFAVRGLTQGSVAAAERHAEDLLRLEERLGIAAEGDLQGWILGHDLLVDLANWIYIYGHWPVIAVALVVLFLRHPDRYWLLRNALFAAGAIGLLIFATYPVAPPRLTGLLEVVDTVTERSEGYRALQPPALVNRYAAMPSLHFGFNLLVGVILWRSRRSWVRVFAVAMPLLMAYAVVATANHWLLDVVVGGAVALAGLAVALALPRVLPVPDWARPRT